MMAIKPHEVVSQVRDFIMASGADAKNQAADVAVAQALQQLTPLHTDCSKKAKGNKWTAYTKGKPVRPSGI
jgi:L-asparaginase II